MTKQQTDGKTSQINGMSTFEGRMDWCEQYIKILLSHKDESQQMHILDGKDISDLLRRVSKLENKEDN